VLPVICIALVLHLGHTSGGARVLNIDMDMLRLAATQRLMATWAEFQHIMVYCATDQCRKRLEVCINAEGGHSEHLLLHCLPDIPVATHHNRLFLVLATFERMQQTFSQMKKFCNSQVSVVKFSGGVGKWITVCFVLR